MKRHAAVELDWADGTFTFRIGISEWEEVEDKCDLSLFEIARLLSPETRRARYAHISNVLRLGLIGGGMTPVDALAKVRKYVDERPIDENRDVAYGIVLAALARVHSNELEQPPGEAQAARSEESTSPLSTETPQ